MTNIAKLEFKALDISGDNYLSWILDAEIHLQSQCLENAIKNGNTMSQQDKAKALIFLRRHIHDDLKTEYLTEKDPLHLWNSLKERYDHQKTVILPNTRQEWLNLRFQDFKSVREYNSAMFRITSKLKLCGEKVDDAQMLEKTFSTFHASNILLQQQYRERHFTKYSELIECLLIAEQNNELLIKNHSSRPTGSTALPEVNANFAHSGRGRGRGRGRGHGRGRGYNSSRGGYGGFKGNKTTNFKKQQKKIEPIKNNDSASENKRHYEEVCYRCGRSGHWSRTCRSSKKTVEEYHRSKNIEANNAEKLPENTNLKLDDFFEDDNGNFINDENLSAMINDMTELIN